MTLSDLSNRGGVCIHISVTDVIHVAFTAIKGHERLCSGSRRSVS